MRVPILIVCSAFALQGARAESLSSADRETLLENLEKLRAASDSKGDARYRLAIAAYRNALANDQSAIELYLNCKEKVDFSDLHKKPAEFREWKRKEGEKLAEPGLRLAIRHQLRWLMLTLEAASTKPDRAKLATDAQEAVDSIFRDADKLKDQQETLGQAVTSSVFARAYDINHVKVENWPLSPIDIKGIYEDILLPPYRKPSTVTTLRSGWIKRIQQETTKQELWGAKRREARDEKDKRIGMASDMVSPEYLDFMEQELPKLQWDMEVDLFRNGDESGASVRMLALLEKYIDHPSNKEWSEQFKKLVQPATAVPGAAPGTASGTAPVAPKTAAGVSP